MPYLLTEQRSAFTPSHRYAVAGQEVTVISDNGGAVIVETMGDVRCRFPVLPTDLSEVPIDGSLPVAKVQIENPEPAPAEKVEPLPVKKATARGKQALPSNQNTLF